MHILFKTFSAPLPTSFFCFWEILRCFCFSSNLLLHDRMMSWWGYTRVGGNSNHTVYMCFYAVSGVVDREEWDESQFLFRLWCRDSFPVVIVLERPEQWRKTCPFQWAAFVLAKGLSHYMQNRNWASWDCVKFKFMKVFFFFFFWMTCMTWVQSISFLM